MRSTCPKCAPAKSSGRSSPKGFRQARNRLAGLTELTEGNIDSALREVKLSLLEADVEIGVVKAFLAKVKEKAIGETGANPTYTSFEGYVVGRIFVEGLRANRQAFTPDNLVAAFESLATLNIGLGGFIGFSPASHQASKSIWGTAINPDGTFTDKYFWSDGSAIQLVE